MNIEKFRFEQEPISSPEPENEIKSEEERKINELEEGLKSNLTPEFFDRHQELKKKLMEKHYKDLKDEKLVEKLCNRSSVLKDLREEFYLSGYQERKITFKKKGDKTSDIVLKIDTLNLGTFEVNLKLKEGPEPEIIIKLNTDIPLKELKLPEELHELFNKLKEKGIFISPIFLVGKHEIRSFGSPEDIPPEIPPPDAKIISEEHLKRIRKEEEELLQRLSLGEKYKELSERFWNWPRIGAKGSRTTDYGIINGPLIFCDGISAIFDTPQGLLSVPFDKLLDPFGYDYGGERKRREQEETRRKEKRSV